MAAVTAETWILCLTRSSRL